MSYETKMATVVADDGTEFNLVVPVKLPSNERADLLRRLYDQHVKPLRDDLGWKGPCEAYVSPNLANDVAESMDFMGSLVDSRCLQGPGCTRAGLVRLFSHGYYAHGF